MKKILISMLSMLLVVFLLPFIDIKADGLEGSGTQQDPYLIQSDDDFAYFADQVNNGNNYADKYLEIKCEIGKENPVSSVIGDYNSKPIKYFSGNLNGNNNIIHINIEDNRSKCIGLFATFGRATVENIIIEGSITYTGTSTSAYVGGLVGFCEASNTIKNCVNNATVVGNKNLIGGITGKTKGKIDGCTNNGSVSGNEDVGGLIGSTENATITNCINTGSVSGGKYTGGIVGYGLNGSSISSCSNSGTIVATAQGAGGILGGNKWASATDLSTTSIIACSNSGNVSGTKSTGGIAGIAGSPVLAEKEYKIRKYTNYNTYEEIDYATTAGIVNCFNSGEITSTSTDEEVGGIIGTLSTGSVVGCINIGKVSSTTGSYWATGIVCRGYNAANDSGIVYCYQLGNELYKNNTQNYQTKNLEHRISYTSGKVDASTCGYFTKEGLGTKNDPYNIYNKEDYMALLNNVNAAEDANDYNGKYISIINDIGSKDDPITNVIAVDSNHYFRGNLNGNNHELYLEINTNSYNHLGLIGYLGSAGTVEDIVVKGSITTTQTTGYYCGLVSINYGKVQNCTNYANISTSGGDGAGIVAFNYGTVDGCVNYGSITGANNTNTSATAGDGTGGIVGTMNHSGTVVVSNCTNYGNVTGTNSVGGVIGRARKNASSTISNVKNGSDSVINTISGSYNVGGVVGVSYVPLTGAVNYGNIISSQDAGGVVGYAGANLTNLTNYGSISGDVSNEQDGTKGVGLGGVVGTLDNSIPSVVDGCYNYGNITNTTSVAGGIVGRARICDGSIIKNCVCGSENITVVIDSPYRSGGIVGATYVPVKDCTNYAQINVVQYGGGIVGMLYNTNVDGCVNNGTISLDGDKGYLGGIVSYATSSSISNSINNGLVSGSTLTGGIVGKITGESYINDCVNNGDIIGAKFTGGIVGQSDAIGVAKASIEVKKYVNYKDFENVTLDLNSLGLNVAIYNCTNNGNVTADIDGYVGGIAGVVTNSGTGNPGSTVFGCVNTGSVAGLCNVGGVIGWAYTNTPASGVQYCYQLGDQVSANSGNSLPTGLTAQGSSSASSYRVAWIGCLSAAEDVITNGENGCYQFTLKGSGTESDPFNIRTVDDFIEFVNEVNNSNPAYISSDTHVQLLADIGTKTSPINVMVGSGYSPTDAIFNGIFDGKNNEIYYDIDITVDTTNKYYRNGLFPQTGGTIKNLVVKGNLNIDNTTTTNYTGGITGSLLEGGTIDNCVSYVNINANASKGHVGGMVGYSKGDIANSSNHGDVSCLASGSDQVGGIVGAMALGSIDNCDNYGMVKGLSSVGGIVGWTYNAITTPLVTNCVQYSNKVYIGDTKATLDIGVADDYLGLISGHSSHIEAIDDSCVVLTSYIKGANVSTYDYIYLNYYIFLDKPENINNFKAVFTQSKADTDDKVTTVQLTQATYDENEKLYRISVPLAATELGDNFDVVLYENNVAVDEVADYSIGDYYINKSGNEKMAKLCTSVLNYGAAAQAYFNYDASNSVNNSLSDELKALPNSVVKDESWNKKVTTGSIDTCTPIGKSIVFSNELKIKYYFNITDDINDYEFTYSYDGKQGTLTPVECNTNGANYYVEVSGIPAEDIMEEVDVVVTKGVDTIDLEYSISTYIYNKFDSENTALSYLVKSLYLYSTTSSEYIENK